MQSVDTIEENIRNLKFSIEFNVYDFNYHQQDCMIRKIVELEELIEQFKNQNEVM